MLFPRCLGARQMLFPRALVLSYGVFLALVDVVASALVSAIAARWRSLLRRPFVLAVGTLGAALLALDAPEACAVVGGRLEVDEVHPVGAGVGSADAEDLGVRS